jgi:hypothetical protein
MADKVKVASSVLGPLAVACAIGIVFSTPAAGARNSAYGLNQAQTQQAAQPAAQSADKPNLAGTWKLNKDQSDDPRQKMREAMGMPNGQGGEGGQNEAGGRPQGGGGGRPGRGQGRGGMMAEWNQLSIEETGATVKVAGTEGRLLATTEPQEKPQANESGNNGGMRFPPAAAEWQGNQLVAKSQGFGGGTTTRTFELSPDGKQLNVTTKIENERFNQPVTFKLVYDRGTPGDKTQ